MVDKLKQMENYETRLVTHFVRPHAGISPGGLKLCGLVHEKAHSSTSKPI